MNPALLLRAAACITALLAVGHALGHPWTPADDPEGQRIVEAMRSYHFDAMGLARSYDDFYQGFGWMNGVYVLAHAVLFWQLASLAKVAPMHARPLVALLCIESILVAALAGICPFWIPLGMLAIIAGLLLLGWISLAPGSRRSPTEPASES
jgi:hypothetical protein